jgi:hypothetical protein
MAKKMSRRKFVKNMMAVGISRNVANWAARIGTEEAMRTLAMIMNQPHVLCITNVAKRKDGWRIRAKGLVKN